MSAFFLWITFYTHIDTNLYCSMTDLEILKANQLIATFMGGKYREDGDYFIPCHCIVNITTIELGKGRITEYHKSWSWLMTVVEKIEEEYDIQIDGDVCTVYCSQNSIKEIIIVGDSKIDATYKAVVEFIKWYNENN